MLPVPGRFGRLDRLLLYVIVAVVGSYWNVGAPIVCSVKRVDLL